MQPYRISFPKFLYELRARSLPVCRGGSPNVYPSRSGVPGSGFQNFPLVNPWFSFTGNVAVRTSTALRQNIVMSQKT